MAGTASDGRRRRGPALADRRQHARPEPGPVKTRLVVHRILLPGNAFARGIGGEFRAIDLEERTCVPALPQLRTRGHGRETRHTGTAEQLDQHCLELVIAMMGGQQPLSRRELALERRIARFSRHGFEAFTSRRLKPKLEDSERDSDSPASEPAALRCVGRSRLQAVIHVHGSQRDAGPCTDRRQGMQQDG